MPFCEYSSTNPLHGILRYFFDLGQDVYDETIEYNASSYETSGGHISEYAFNFNLANHWIGRTELETYPNLTFCFKQHYAKLQGFELATSDHGTLTPEVFMFSSSKEKNSFSNFQTYTKEYNQGDIIYFDYKSEPSKCFQLTCIANKYGSTEFDVGALEVYGEYYPKLANFKVKSYLSGIFSNGFYPYIAIIIFGS